MIFMLTSFILSWIIFGLFADKKRFLGQLPTCYFAMILGFLTDFLVEAYPLWEYTAANKWEHFFVEYLDELGIYFVITYLFLQTLPKQKTFSTMFLHIFIWTIPSLLIELVALKIKAMEHHLWWNIYYSYICDWFLYFIFYKHHQLYAKEFPSTTRP
ncbi:hypothetical protein DCCM_2695 [Desulfocucumis palustris]|uniref:Uncharacterized protein n=1 Tax=Desulfocucumis palustris TaxID=1898651 RepID=A0A2L2XBA7_9FIRM|nr:CBO0543 family protein [Desulfocucumis palustris]GBF33589.1 hypothetical protein DCCM_2695 [Desulfocucumis palustris]